MTKHPEQMFDVEQISRVKGRFKIHSNGLVDEVAAIIEAPLDLALEVAQGKAFVCRVEEGMPKDYYHEPVVSFSPPDIMQGWHWNVVIDEDDGDGWYDGETHIPIAHLTFNGKPTLPEIKE